MEFRVVVTVVLLALSIGCGSALEPARGSEADDGVGPETELRVRTGVTTLWVDKVTSTERPRR